MDRSKVVAILTGIISLLLGIAYLLVVQFLDFRGEMIPAPQDLSYQPAPMELQGEWQLAQLQLVQFQPAQFQPVQFQPVQFQLESK